MKRLACTLSALSFAVAFAACQATPEDSEVADESATASEATSAASTDSGQERASGEQKPRDCAEIDEKVHPHLEYEGDLNGDGRPDRIMENIENCGASSCKADILIACEGGGYEAVDDVGYTGRIGPVDQTTNGWRDLCVRKAGGWTPEGTRRTAIELYRWDGESYEFMGQGEVTDGDSNKDEVAEGCP